MGLVPRDIANDFFGDRCSELVPFSVNDSVEVTGGSHAGRLAAVVSIASLHPTVFIVEFGDDGSEGGVDASLLRRLSPGADEPDAYGSDLAFSYGDYGDLDAGRVVWHRNVPIAEIRRTISTASLKYGTELRLRLPDRTIVLALSTWGPVEPPDPGRFLVYNGDSLVARDASREGVVEYFAKQCL